MKDKEIDSTLSSDKYIVGFDQYGIDDLSRSLENEKEIFDKKNKNATERLIQAYKASVANAIQYPSSYSISKSPRRPKNKIPQHEREIREDIRYNLKKEYTLQECLDVFIDLQNKQIGDIYLTGSVALYLQGKISRTEFKDLDIVVVGEYMLDDDIYDNPFASKYPPDENEVERSALAFNNVKIDLFSNVHMVTFIDVEYLGKTYRCQDYKDIIKAKLRMVLPKVKDIDELLGKSFEIIYK